MNRFRRVLTRWEKKVENYEAMLNITCSIIVWNKTPIGIDSNNSCSLREMCSFVLFIIKECWRLKLKIKTQDIDFMFSLFYFGKQIVVIY